MEQLRFLLPSTPRSGNTWFRQMVARIYELQEGAVHRPADVDWQHLPPRWILQLHWNRTPALLAQLASSGLAPILITRHPLDVLISICHFCNFEPQTRYWLDGRGGDESVLLGAAPSDAEFLAYALSERAAAVLSVSVEWRLAQVPYVRYEDLVRNPASVLQQFAEILGQPCRNPVQEAVESFSMSKLRASSRNYHFWQGNPGHWRYLLPESTVRQIYERHRRVFEVLGYSVDGARDESASELRRRWEEICMISGHSSLVSG